jgi:hypothetical protein
LPHLLQGAQSKAGQEAKAKEDQASEAKTKEGGQTAAASKKAAAKQVVQIHTVLS